MGVKGLTAFLRTHTQSISHPALRDLAHHTLLLDSNLLTTKFHYSRAHTELPPLVRIEVQWLTFLRTLLRHGIRPVVVLDGETRIGEKDGENQRRDEGRRLMRSRGEVERGRGERWEAVRKGGRWDGEDLRMEEEGSGGESRSSRVLTEDYETMVRGLRGISVGVEVGSEVVGKVLRENVEETTGPMSTIDSSVDALDSSGAVDAVERLDMIDTSGERDTGETIKQIDTIDYFPSTPFPPSLDSPSDQQVLESLSGITITESISPAESMSPALPIPTSTPLSPSSLSTLSSLISRSNTISSSYLTRSTPPPSSWPATLLSLAASLDLPHYQPSPDAPYEAEGICAYLQREGRGHWVVSEDLDVVVWGGKLLRGLPLRSYASTSASPEGEEGEEGDEMYPTATQLTAIDPASIHTSLGLTPAQFLEFALLCGTDFTTRIPRVGPVTALKLLRAHGSIEGILDGQAKYGVGGGREEWERSVEAGKKVFRGIPSGEEFGAFFESLPRVDERPMWQAGGEWREGWIEERLRVLLGREMEEEVVDLEADERLYAMIEAQSEGGGMEGDEMEGKFEGR